MTDKYQVTYWNDNNDAILDYVTCDTVEKARERAKTIHDESHSINTISVSRVYTIVSRVKDLFVFSYTGYNLAAQPPRTVHQHVYRVIEQVKVFKESTTRIENYDNL